MVRGKKATRALVQVRWDDWPCPCTHGEGCSVRGTIQLSFFHTTEQPSSADFEYVPVGDDGILSTIVEWAQARNCERFLLRDSDNVDENGQTVEFGYKLGVWMTQTGRPVDEWEVSASILPIP